MKITQTIKKQTPNEAKKIKSAILTKNYKKEISGGFTLVEVIICIAILCTLSAIALPTFLSTTDTAEASAMIGSMSSFAKSCGSKIMTNDPVPLSGVAATIQVSNSAVCDGSANIQINNSTRFNARNIGGLSCGGIRANGTTNHTCTLTIDRQSGSITANWSP